MYIPFTPPVLPLENNQYVCKALADGAPVSSAAALTVWEPKVKVDLTRYTEKHEFAFDDVFPEVGPA